MESRRCQLLRENETKEISNVEGEWKGKEWSMKWGTEKKIHQ